MPKLIQLSTLSLVLVMSSGGTANAEEPPRQPDVKLQERVEAPEVPQLQEPAVKGDDRAGFLRKRPSKIEKPDIASVKPKPEIAQPKPVIEGDDRVGFLRKRPAKVKPTPSEADSVKDD
tara:strand:- start:1990 stop:2346 length:357 start_codon:yes stop_codon:yes gene_type:complete